MNASLTYRALSGLVQPALPLYLRLRLARGKEIKERIPERYGIATRPRPEGKLLWVHAASVGESMSVLPLLQCLLELNSDLQILVTSGTVASAQLLAKRLPPRCIHQFHPLDTPAYAARFLDHWRPVAALWVESELWPNLVSEMAARRIPAARINARLTARSAHGWQRFSTLFRQMLSAFSLSLAIGRSDAMRLEQAGAPDVRAIGNLKFTAPAPAYDAAQYDALRDAIGTRPVWFMASSHKGEEALAERMHRQLMDKYPDVLTVIAPRHTARAEEVANSLQLPFARRSLGELPEPAHAVYLADTMGEMGMLFRACGLTLVGGSFTPKGGHSPIEPAQCGCATLIGPDTSKCEDAVSELAIAGALVKVETEATLLEQLMDLLGNEARRTAMQQAGINTTTQQERILNAYLQALGPLLAPAGIQTA